MLIVATFIYSQLSVLMCFRNDEYLDKELVNTYVILAADSFLSADCPKIKVTESVTF